MEVLLIVGLPGSGKTHLLTTYAKQGWTCLDDLSVTETTTSALMVRLGELADCSNVAIADPVFCLKSARDNCEKLLRTLYPSCTISTVFFEHNVEQCLINAKVRGSREVAEDIKSYAAHYEIPEGATVLKVFKGENDE